MNSLRAKLAIQYAAVLAGALAVLAFALFAVQSSEAVREATDRGALRGDLALRVLRSITSERDPVVVPVPDRGRGAGSGVPPGGGEIRAPEGARSTDPNEADLRVRFQLDALPGILLAFNQKGEDFYRSLDVQRLSTADSAQLWRVLRRFGTATSARALLNGESVVLVRRVEENPNLHRYQVVTGVAVGSAALSLLGASLVIVPVLLLGAVAVTYTITNRALEPLDRITSEVAAISDGKSLHRRLHTEGSNDEWGRLITQLNAMIERLETSFGALRRFTADASHELKTPLAVLRADVERAMHVPQGSSEQLVALEEALQETTRMASLVESLLTLARADEGRFDLHRERIQLLPVVRDVYETAVILGEDARLRVTMPAAQEATVDGDPTRLRQLLLNLITNAIKYTPPGGEVELSLVRSDDEVTFSVRDTGIGIAAADLPHIFERFYRADRVRSRMDERGGFGLGLSISQWIAQAHGGSLVVQSRLHRGSTFTVTLPLAADEATDELEVAEAATARAGG